MGAGGDRGWLWPSEALPGAERSSAHVVYTGDSGRSEAQSLWGGHPGRHGHRAPCGHRPAPAPRRPTHQQQVPRRTTPFPAPCPPPGAVRSAEPRTPRGPPPLQHVAGSGWCRLAQPEGLGLRRCGRGLPPQLPWKRQDCVQPHWWHRLGGGKGPRGRGRSQAPCGQPSRDHACPRVCTGGGHCMLAGGARLTGPALPGTRPCPPPRSAWEQRSELPPQASSLCL